MKGNIFKPVVLLLVLFAAISCEKPETKPATEENNIHENHDIFVCGVNAPLQDIEWLREYCKSLNEIQYISSVRIDLYKVIDSDEHFFKTSIVYSEDSDFSCSYSVNWKNCMGEYIIGLSSCVPPAPEVEERYKEFLKNKEYVVELFHLVKQ